MYEESKIEFDWKGFLFKLAFLIVALILIIKLLPLNRKSSELSTEFKNNMATLRVKSNSYFTGDKLPSKTNETVKVTLDDLIKVGAIRRLQDNNGNECNNKDSFVSATKKSSDYELEIHLVCGDEAETSFVYFNSSDEEQITTKETTDTTTTAKDINTNGNQSGDKSNSSKPTGSKTTGSKTNNNVGYETTKVKQTTAKASHVSVIFNSNGGTKISTQSVSKGSRAIRPSNPTRSGYIFLGWFDGNREYNFNSLVNSNIILIAKWTPISNINQITTTRTTARTTSRPTSSIGTTARRVTVNFDTKGGTRVSSQVVDYGDYVRKPSNPTKSNAKFVGWYLNNREYNFNSRVTGSITLVAKYEEKEEYKMSVYTAGYGVDKTSFSISHRLAVPSSLQYSDYNNVKIKSVKFNRSLSTTSDLNNYRNLHRTTFEYNYNNSDYTSGVVSNLARISGATFSINNRDITWRGSVSSQCTTKFNYLDMRNACLYGIVYDVVWEYNTIK